MNGTTKIEELAKKRIVLDGVSRRVIDALFKFRKLFADVTGIIKIAKSIEADCPKGSPAVPHNKGLEVKYAPRQRGQVICIIIPTQRANQRYNFQQVWRPKRKATQCWKQIM